MAQKPKPGSTRPYLIRALYEWCADNRLTPYLLVHVDERSRVPPGYAKDGQIVLNIGAGATRNLTMDNDWIRFSARFGGVSQEISVPVNRVAAIYARENGEGMKFPVEETAAEQTTDAADSAGEEPNSPEPPKGRPKLKIIK
jgi:stringent starvation protein B